MDSVATLEIRDPVPFFVDVKRNDPSRRAARGSHDFGVAYTLGVRRSSYVPAHDLDFEPSTAGGNEKLVAPPFARFVIHAVSASETAARAVARRIGKITGIWRAALVAPTDDPWLRLVHFSLCLRGRLGRNVANDLFEGCIERSTCGFAHGSSPVDPSTTAAKSGKFYSSNLMSAGRALCPMYRPSNSHPSDHHG